MIVRRKPSVEGLLERLSRRSLSAPSMPLASGPGFTDYGLVSALPGSPSKGDRCQYIADKTNGVIWHLVYDGEGTYPWKKIGGPPLFEEVTAAETTTSNTYTNLATTGPSITTPLAGDYDVEIGARISNSTNSALMSYAIGGTGASDNDSVDHAPGSGGAVTTHQSRPRRKTGLAKSTALVAKYRRNAEGTASFACRWMRISPVRLG